MPDETLFPLDDVPLVPLVREPRARRGAAAGSRLDGRFKNEYPPDWDRCTRCGGTGRVSDGVPNFPMPTPCLECKGMGSVKARVRLEAGHRCVRCKHPFMTKRDAKMLGVEPSPGMWSPCDLLCEHRGPLRWRPDYDSEWHEATDTPSTAAEWLTGSETDLPAYDVDAFWRVLTTHHLDGDKANLAWWNLAALCQRCHLEIQSKVVMERVYPHEHSEWFRPYAAGYYAKVYLDEDLTREQVESRMDELLALERAA